MGRWTWKWTSHVEGHDASQVIRATAAYAVQMSHVKKRERCDAGGAGSAGPGDSATGSETGRGGEVYVSMLIEGTSVGYLQRGCEDACQQACAHMGMWIGTRNLIVRWPYLKGAVAKGTRSGAPHITLF